MTNVRGKTELVFDCGMVSVRTKDRDLKEKLDNFCNVYPSLYQHIQNEDSDYYILPERDVYLKLIHR